MATNQRDVSTRACWTSRLAIDVRPRIRWGNRVLRIS